MPLPSKQVSRTAAEEKKKALIQRFLNAHTRPNRAENVCELPKEATPLVPLSPAIQPTSPVEKFGNAQVPVFREGEQEPSGVSLGLIALINLYLQSAKDKSRHIVMMWPAAPATLLAVHALATLERWKIGDKRGIRGLIFPAKNNVFFPLNHLHFGRDEVLRLAQNLVELSGQPNLLVTRGLQEKDAYLFSLGSLKPDKEEQFNPTVGELLPRFYAGSDFSKWNSCSDELLENIAARLKRRAHKKALQSNRDVIGHPKTAPDALFAVDGRLSKEEARAALLELRKVGRPDAILVNATRPIRKGTRGWQNQLVRFCDVVDEVFREEKPGIIIVTDEPHAAFQLKEQLVESNNKKPREMRWNASADYKISAICNGVREDGLRRPGTGEPPMPMPREYDVEVVDTEANRVINRLYRIATRVPGGRDAAQPVLDAAAYLSRLAALPCGVSTLVDWLSSSSASEQARRIYSWSAYYATLSVFERSGKCGLEQKEIQECLKLGSKLYENYHTATPFALRLAELVGTSAAVKKRQTVLVFTSAIYRRLAQRFLSQFSDFPGEYEFAQFSNRVQFILSSELEDLLPHLSDVRLIFAGLDEDGLRLLMLDNRIEKHTAILLTQRAGQYLRAALRPLVERFDEFKPLKPRMESILRQLASLPEDRSILSLGDFVLPVFRAELSQDSSEDSGATDPDACKVVLENRQILYRKPSQHVYVYDPASEYATDRGFRTCEVLSLRPGDRLFVMSPELRELVETVLKEAGVPIEHDKTFETALRGYHRIVTERLQKHFPGKNLTDQVRQLRDVILKVNPKLSKDFPAALSVRHWVNLGESTGTPFEELQPQALMKEAHFAAFAQALGFSNLEAAYYWQGVIVPVRNARRLDGRHVSDLYSHMLLQPESAMVHSNIKPHTMRLLFNKARENVVIIESIIFPAETNKNV